MTGFNKRLIEKILLKYYRLLKAHYLFQGDQFIFGELACLNLLNSP
jgi:hypothetical protein